uniref:CSON014348 protein n=1 Tax=Culicoides sonorensis TaxID=179676 RepID=A0A336KS27_CULSO
MSTPLPPSCTYMTPPQYIPHNNTNNGPLHVQPQFYHGAPGHPNYMVGCYPANGWTGIPLISTAPRRPRRGAPNALNRTQSLGGFDEQSISRLAMHAHGAPLISIGNRYGNNNNNNQRKVMKKDALRTLSLNEEKSSYMRHDNHNNTSVVDNGSSDTRSDENSQQTNTSNNGSGTNETCLPRIIKPRKRRKKDRKPTTVTDSINTVDNISNDNSKIILIENSCNNNNYSQNLPPTPSDIVPSNNCSCNCKLCDPLGKLWSINPLRRSCSDNSSDVIDEHRRTKDVGVIGGDRRVTNTRNEWRSLPQILPNTCNNNNNNNNENTRKSSLSDSGDSGCAADILSGLNITDDLLAVGRDLFATPSSDTTLEYQLPSSSSSFNFIDYNNKYHDTSLNELSRQLSETLDLKSDGGRSSSDSGSVLSDSVFSDGVPDLFVNFDSISKNQLFSANNISKLSNLLFVDDNNLTSPALVQISPASSTTSNQHSSSPQTITRQIIMSENNNNNNNLKMFNNSMINVNNNHYDNNQNHKNCNQNDRLISNCLNNNINNNTCVDQPFIFIPDKDRSSEIYNCFDMVWNGVPQN